jgi:hypothetical protein
MLSHQLYSLFESSFDTAGIHLVMHLCQPYLYLAYLISGSYLSFGSSYILRASLEGYLVLKLSCCVAAVHYEHT